MRKFLAIVLTLVMVFTLIPFGAVTVNAETASGTTGDCTWSLDGTVLTISGNGAMANYRNSSTPWGNSITEVIIEYGVTNIGEEAFYDCKNLSSVTIPNSVTSIDYYAFGYCQDLWHITLPNSITTIGKSAFEGTDLYEITIPNSVTHIGDSAFALCCSLGEIIIPNSVTHIGDGAFICSGLYYITIPDSVTSICGGIVEETPYYCDAENWENDVLYINNHLIKAKSTLSGNYNIKQGTKTIAGHAFHNCDGITNITIPNSVTHIGNDAFRDCSALTNITIPNSVTSIGIYAFYNCDVITNITIPNSVTSIDFFAFGSCSALTNINVDSNNLYYSSQDGVLFNVDKTTLIQYPSGKKIKNYTIPNSVTHISSHAFYSCSNLTSVTIGNSITNIDNIAFDVCYNLTDVWYKGTQSDREKIIVNDNNYHLTNAIWHYNTCDNHIYDNVCDSSCNNCDWTRSVAPHKFTNYIYNDDAKCETDGTKTAYCDNGCGDTQTIVAEGTATGHSYYATYLADENQHWRLCALCQHKKDIANHEYDNACDNSCNVCGYIRTISGHKWLDATCTAPKTCEYCNKTDGVSLGHNFKNYVYNNDGKCEADGTKTAYCDNGCGDTQTIVAEGTATGHSYFSNYNCNQEQHWYMCAICFDKKDIADHEYDNACDKNCNICGYTRQVPDHKYTAKVEKAATCAAAGIMKHTCSCGNSYTNAIAKTNNHNYTPFNIKATYTSAGSSGNECTVCGLKANVKVIPKLVPKKTKISKLTAKKKSLVVKVKKEKTVTGYQIQYSLKKNFKGAKTVTIKKNSTITKTIKKLKSKKTYYLRVRTYKTYKGKKYYSAWSKTSKKKTK
ncbi:MAG: leucine-rich repeat domain-containing protein [Ruminococcaceae bacterium]|nr:leucine-rich repeat domain-containing protein [Oscillospiraceae bacterium]